MLTLEMCKRLKDAGFRQDTELGYFQVPDGKRILWTASSGGAEVACPTADEIWAELNSEQRSDFSFNLCSNYSYEWKRDMFFSIETALAEYWLEVNE